MDNFQLAHVSQICKKCNPNENTENKVKLQNQQKQ